jgi:multiple sugar transport system ATP-binding protein
MLEIGELMDRKPSELSGGQMQRVAVGRALVRDPVAFLLDEPLSNLDAKLRTQMRGEIVDLHKRTGRTFIYVTHDQAEAMSMSDRIAVFMAGKIVQVATPRELFEFPATREVAAFVGDRPINLIEVDVEGASLSAPFDAFAVAGNTIPKRVVVGIRPETVNLDPNGPLSGHVERLEYLGSEAIVTFRLNIDHVLRVTLDTSQPVPLENERACLRIRQGGAHLFDAETGVRLKAELVLKNADSRRGV